MEYSVYKTSAILTETLAIDPYFNLKRCQNMKLLPACPFRSKPELGKQFERLGMGKRNQL
jgi:hypothetical protein